MMESKSDDNSEVKTKFARETIDQISRLHFNNEKTKYTPDALTMTTEMMKIYVLEAAHRAAFQAKTEGKREVEVEHLEKILPQLLLDFN